MLLVENFFVVEEGEAVAVELVLLRVLGEDVPVPYKNRLLFENKNWNNWDGGGAPVMLPHSPFAYFSGTPGLPFVQL